MVLLDVTPHSLGVRIKEGRMSTVIPKNTTIPTSEKKLFATTRDDQDFVEIMVYQGERQLVDHNTFLGRFVLGDLPVKSAGQVNVEVTFLLDADGVLNVSARELSSGRQASVKISPSSGLSRGQVDNLSRAARAQGRLVGKLRGDAAAAATAPRRNACCELAHRRSRAGRGLIPARLDGEPHADRCCNRC